MESLAFASATAPGWGHSPRRSFLRLGGLAGLGWLLPVSQLLAEAGAEGGPAKRRRAKSLIVLWLAGGPSQIETFDPHPDSKIAYGTKGIRSAVPGIELAEGLPLTAEWMGEIALVRSLVSQEADHERAVYAMKTGYRPNPTVVHPAIGAILCHESQDPDVEIPRHISILPGRWPARGGYFGPQFDAFQVADPRQPVGDVTPQVPDARFEARWHDLEVVEAAFAAGRPPELETRMTLHRAAMTGAARLMRSAQLAAFDLTRAPASQRQAYGDTPFGRGCLAALRLVETGVRCVEVTLDGWDTHVNNHALQRGRVEILDPAFAALLRDLKERGLLQDTVVLCGGEFGRTPLLNSVDGRDHWPHGFSVALAGGGFRGGTVLGATDPAGEQKAPDRPVPVADLHATIQRALGLDPDKELITPVGRPLTLSDGRVRGELLAG